MDGVSGAFACETARSRRVEIRGLDLHLLEWGPAARSGVLLLHGGAAHAHWFDAVATALAAELATSWRSTSAATGRARGQSRPRTRPRTSRATSSA